MSTSCEAVIPLLAPYADGELDVARVAVVEQHLAQCPGCMARLDDSHALRVAIGRAPYHRAPDALRRAVPHPAGGPDAAPAAAAKATRGFNLRHAVAALAACLLLSVTINVGMVLRRDDAAIGNALFDAHLRSLMSDHVADVLSSDQHTVKPWFAGKLDFSPVVRDLSSSGFPLVGGRLDVIERRKVAVLIYRHRLHVINVFVWPASSAERIAISMRAFDGYTLIHWRENDMDWWALSDLGRDDLEKFATLMQKSASQEID